MGKGTSLYEFAFYYDQPVDQFNFQIVCTDGVTFPSVKWTTFSPSLATWYLILGWWDAVNHQLGIRVNNGTPIVSSPGTSLVIRDTTEDFRIGGNVAGADGVDGRIDQAIFGLKAPTLADMDFIWNGGAGRNFTQMGLSLASLTPVSAPQNTTQTLTLAGTRFRGGDL